jgi:hypothetical protein
MHSCSRPCAHVATRSIYPALKQRGLLVPMPIHGTGKPTPSITKLWLLGAKEIA